MLRNLPLREGADQWNTGFPVACKLVPYLSYLAYGEAATACVLLPE